MFKSKFVKTLTASVVLASGLFVSAGSTFAAKDFTDLYDNESHAHGVVTLNSYDAFDYKEGTKLNGNQAITRGEVSQILYNIFQYSTIEKRSYNGDFKDVNSTTEFYDAIVWSYEIGVFDGSNGKFNPDQTLTRAQMSKILVTMFNLKSDSKQSFKDTQNHWASDYINALYTNGYANGTGNGMFSPQGKLTLNQFSTFLARIINDGKEPHKDYGYDTEGIKTSEEVYAIAVDLYNSKPFAKKKVTVKTTEDLSDKFNGLGLYAHDFSKDVKGYMINNKYIGVTSNEISDGLYETSILLHSNKSEEEVNELAEKMDNTVQHIKDNYDVSSDYNKVLAVNKFLADQLTYDVDIQDHPFLPDGSSVCEDYASAASALLSGLGMEVIYVTGADSTGEGHAWNLVKVDGLWYHTDPTFYDTGGRDRALLMTEGERKNYKIPTIDSTFKATDVLFNK